MGVKKLALVAFVALVASSSSAFALDVNKHIAAPAQLLVVWSTISEFCSIKDWHPAIADCKESKEGADTFRVLTLKDNGGTIKEKLTGSDDTSYSYEIVESPLPVKNYSAKLWVEPDDRDPLGCDLRRQWQERRGGNEGHQRHLHGRAQEHQAEDHAA
jgi:hypothetical protein